jgi:MFS family permease
VTKRTLPLYIGGFLGPFGGGVVAVLVPELRAAFHASTSLVAYALPAYLVPFAAVQLVSGTIGERLDPRRVVRVAYVAYAVASALAGLAPTIGVFLAARAAQGVANAFTTPLLLAALADIVEPRRLGRSIGTFAGVQAAAVSAAPLAGGLAAAWNWRVAFIAPAVVAAILVATPPPRREAASRATPSLRAVVSPRLAILCLCAIAGYVGITGLPFLISVRISDTLHLAAGTRGLVLAAYGAAGFMLGNAAGRIVERRGARRSAQAGAFLAALCIWPIGFASSTPGVVIAWTAAGAASALVWAGLNTLALETSATNRAGIVGVFQAAKFAGYAAAPIMLLPVYSHSPPLAFIIAALIGASIIPLVASVEDTRRHAPPLEQPA